MPLPTTIGAASARGLGFSRTYSASGPTPGGLWAWGRNQFGPLGLGNTTNYSSPKQVGALTTWLSAAAGFYHTLATRS